MEYPNPLTVRMVKESLRDIAKEGAIAGSSAVVNTLLGSFWGRLLDVNKSRQYLNFVGELAGRVVSPKVGEISNQYYADNNTVYFNGRPKVAMRGYDDEIYYVDRGGPIGTRGYKSNLPPKKNNYNDYGRDRNAIRPPVQRNYSQPKSMLDEALEEVSRAHKDFSFSSAIKECRDKILGLLPFQKRKDELAEALLQGCYEYLESTGEDAYYTMVTALQSPPPEGDFSEDGDVDMKAVETAIQSFMPSVELWKYLNDVEKHIVRGYLTAQFGVELSGRYIWELENCSSTGTVPDDKSLKFFKKASILGAAFALMRVLFTRPKIGRN